MLIYFIHDDCIKVSSSPATGLVSNNIGIHHDVPLKESNEVAADIGYA